MIRGRCAPSSTPHPPAGTFSRKGRTRQPRRPRSLSAPSYLAMRGNLVSQGESPHGETAYAALTSTALSNSMTLSPVLSKPSEWMVSIRHPGREASGRWCRPMRVKVTVSPA